MSTEVEGDVQGMGQVQGGVHVGPYAESLPFFKDVHACNALAGTIFGACVHNGVVLPVT